MITKNIDGKNTKLINKLLYLLRLLRILLLDTNLFRSIYFTHSYIIY